MGGRLRDPRTALGLALVVGLAVRVARVAEQSLIHPDGPAYLSLARAVLDGQWGPVFGGYYSPLYPITIAPLVAAGLPAETAGRLAAALAGVLALPLLFCIARRVADDTIAAIAVLVASLHPALVKASGQVLPEPLAGCLLLAWGAVLMDAKTIRRVAAAGALAGATYLARPEGVLLVPLGVAWLGWRRRAAAVGPTAAYLLAALVVMAPAVLALHARSATWQISRREAVATARAGVSDETTLAGAVRRHPAAIVTQWASGAGQQTWDTVVAIGPVLALPFALGLGALPPAWPLAVVVAFVVGPLTFNPGTRYAVPILPLLLPWVAAGLLTIGERLGRHARPAVTVVALVLLVQALWRGKPFDEACSREVGDLVRSRYGRGQSLVAVDGRFAYLADGKAIVPKTTQPGPALALARKNGARLWLTRPYWVGKRFVLPAGVREVARPCTGTFVLYELEVPLPE
jgi:4-amino-4-deoxy-L-arabinose transferase-like glycosyltransferase